MAASNGGAGDQHRSVAVYTDGSCPYNGQPNAYAGFGVFWPDYPPLWISDFLDGPIQTSCRAELKAAIVALEQAYKHGLMGRLTIYTDSTYVKRSVTEWIPDWKSRGWRRPSGEVANLDFMKSLDHLNDLVKPRWVWVQAHSKLEGNERADLLAKQGAAKHPWA